MNPGLNSKTLFQELVSSIKTGQDTEEIQSMVCMLMENVWNISRTEMLGEKAIPYSAESLQKMSRMIRRLNDHEPVQYVLGEEYFYGRKFQVNPAVLIPRPETEVLIRVVLDYQRATSQNNKMDSSVRILDIGTGSGCIPITLFLEITEAEVHATDISKAALTLAKQNAENLHAKIDFFEHNILQEEIEIKNPDVIVSNPPYVTEKEKGDMEKNVLDFEPHLALFVADDDPLVFYDSIVKKAKNVLSPGGLLAVEINAQFGKAVSQRFLRAGFKEVEIIKDIDGKERVVRGVSTIDH